MSHNTVTIYLSWLRKYLGRKIITWKDQFGSFPKCSLSVLASSGWERDVTLCAIGSDSGKLFGVVLNHHYKTLLELSQLLTHFRSPHQFLPSGISREFLAGSRVMWIMVWRLGGGLEVEWSCIFFQLWCQTHKKWQEIQSPQDTFQDKGVEEVATQTDHISSSNWKGMLKCSCRLDKILHLTQLKSI